MYNPLKIANYFLKKSFDSGVEVTPIKVLKLCYLAHGWNLGVNGQPLISEAVQAWKYGPVISSVYEAFKQYGREPIRALYADVQGADPNDLDENTVALLDRVWEIYKSYSGPQLSTLTHEPGSPWYQKWEVEGGKNQRSTIIDNDRIRLYYASKMEQAA